MTRHLMHCIYASAAISEFGTGQLAALLSASRHNNHRLGITGLLLYADGSFFQVLEGEPAAVEALSQKIARDPRHTNVTHIISEPIPRRVFTDWSMGFLNLSPERLAELGGARNLLSSPSSVAALQNGRARKLLMAFCEGRWRIRFTPPRHRVLAGI